MGSRLGDGVFRLGGGFLFRGRSLEWTWRHRAFWNSEHRFQGSTEPRERFRAFYHLWRANLHELILDQSVFPE